MGTRSLDKRTEGSCLGAIVCNSVQSYLQKK